MNRNAGFTLYGVYDYFEEKEEPLFENIRLYNGGTYAPGTEYEQIIPAIDKNVLTDEIIERWGDFLCWRQIPDMFKSNVIRFFSKNYDKIVKNDEKVLEIVAYLLYNKHWACKNHPY